MKNAYFTSNDMIHIHIYDEEEAIDLFGEYTFEEFETTIPEELLKSYQETLEKFKEIQNKLREHKK
jgi:activator of HSP90 ATPase